VFEKKQLDRFSRRDRDIVLDVLKKGVSQLTRLRHPKILSILHPLEESRFFKFLSDMHGHNQNDVFKILEKLPSIKDREQTNSITFLQTLSLTIYLDL